MVSCIKREKNIVILRKSMDNITIREFRESDAKELAEMWNECDLLIPGEMSGGASLTAEVVIDAYFRANIIHRTIALEGKEIIASMDMIAGMDNEIYVTNIVVKPSHQRSLVVLRLVFHNFYQLLNDFKNNKYTKCKRLITQTWPSNQIARRLYQRCGFYEISNGDFSNYLPGLMQNQLCREYLLKHKFPFEFVPYDYTILQIMKTHKEEELRANKYWKNLRVYPYYFNMDGDIFHVYIDELTQDFTLFENNNILVFCSVFNPNITVGIPRQIEWKIKNKQDKTLPVKFKVETDNRISLCNDLEKSFILKQREEITIKDKARCSSGSSGVTEIKTVLEIDNQKILLKSGLKIFQPLTISFESGSVLLQEQEETKIPINIQNNTDKQITGFLNISSDSSSVRIKENRKNYSVKALASLSIPITLEAEKGGIFFLEVNTYLNQWGISVPRKIVTIKVPKPLEIIGGISDSEAVVENDYNSFVFNKSNGRMGIIDKFNGKVVLSQDWEELGPPYKFLERGSDFNNFETSLEKKDDFYIVTISASSINYQGLILQKKLFINSSSITKIEYKLHNTSSKNHSPTLMIKTKNFQDNAHIIFPVNDRVVSEPFVINEFPDERFIDLPLNSGDYGEGWSCFQVKDRISGLIWNKADRVEYGESKLPYLFFRIPQIKSGENIELDSIYMFSGYGNWKIIQKYYQNFFGKKEKTIAAEKVERINIFNANWENDPILLRRDTQVENFTLENCRRKPIRGKITIRVPKGSSVHPNKFDVLSTFDQPFKKDLVIKSQRPENFDITFGKISFRTQFADRDALFPMVFVPKSKDNFKYREKKEENHRIVEWENGTLKFKICPDKGGSLFGMESEEVNYLCSSFPEDKSLFSFYPWRGGIYSLISYGSREKLYLLFPEINSGFDNNFTYERQTRLSINKQIKWQGLKLTSNYNERRLRGVELEIEYLSIPRSKILAILTRITNNSTQLIKLNYLLCCFLNISKKKSILYFERNDNLYHRKGTCYSAQVIIDEWAAVKNFDLKVMESLISTNKESMLEAMDCGRDGMHLFENTNLKIGHGEKKEMITYVVITPGLEKLRGIKNFLKKDELI